MRAIGRLLRLSLAPSALADVAAGLVFANAGVWPAGAGPFWLMGSSACVYHGAMALNDWRDREHDARTRPSRPIPSGAVSPQVALALGVGLLLCGPLLARHHSGAAALWSLALALLASFYDLAGRGAWLGPALLALCRSGNLGLGLCFARAGSGAPIAPATALIPMALYAMYVLRVSQLGRLEDGEERISSSQRARALVLSAALMLACVPLIPPFSSDGAPWPARAVSMALAWPAAFTLARVAFASRAWSRADVEHAMGLALRRLLVFAAALAALAWRAPRFDAWLVAAAILAGYAISAQLRRVFPPS